MIRKVMLTFRDQTAAILDHTTLADLSIDRAAAYSFPSRKREGKDALSPAKQKRDCLAGNWD